MRLNKIKKNKNINFNSGLSKKDIKLLSTISADNAEKYFQKSFMIKTDFEDNQTFSVLNLLCKNILIKLGHSKILDNLSFNSNPNSIKIFDKNELTRQYPDTFCTSATKKIIKNEPTYRPISLFFRNDKISIEEINEAARIAKKNEFISNDNFLAFVMHEWMHSIHLNYLYKKNGFNERRVIEEIKKIKQIDFNDTEKSILREQLGKYVYNKGKINPIEVLAEGLNKIICSCLDKDRISISSSLDESIYNTQTNLVQIIKKILQF